MENLKQLLLYEIPYLRRYACALTGNIEDGDELVKVCLSYANNLINFLKPNTSLKIWLFSVMHKVSADFFETRQLTTLPPEENYDFSYQGLDLDSSMDLEKSFDPADVLSTLPLLEREAFLLVSLEGFSYDAVREILTIPTGTLVSLLDNARKKVVDQFLDDTFAELRYTQ